ncbi:MAG: DUF4328 domain-containing protein [Erythrobacter sp.]|uniref:DUF4328 domain-containing protein n=1 Tax=Erythrobacter sp. TaxID=1042 RepID=UPI0025F0F552|nr:DUF4328 domain-containing protein [Erythrobacter sp.]MCM0000558.1 DUF4328 domain-containing protein [Erythrobacter sp.]
MQTGNLRTFALLATIGAWMVFALSLLCVVMTGLSVAYRDPGNELAPLPAAVALIAIALNLTFLASVVPVLLWTYTAHANLRAAGIKGLRHSPGWATLSFFVPVANLFVPFVAMRELANRSAGEPEEFAGSSVDDVSSWWSCWVVSAIVMTIVMLTLFVDALPGIWVTTPLWAVLGLTLFGQLLFAGAAWFLIKVLRQVTDNQVNGAVDLGVFE